MQYKIKTLCSILMVMGVLSGCVKTESTDNAVVTNTQISPEDVPHVFALPTNGDDVVGSPIVIAAQKGDTLASLAQKYDFGYQDLVSANPNINPDKLISVGKAVTLPSVYILPPAQYRKGIVINIPELRLFYFGSNEVMTFPVALGREGWRTPVAKTYVYKKTAAPTWHVPESIRQYYFEKYGVEHPKEIGAGPDNPLGNYAIYLQMTGYLIHGTNAPSSIGNFVSSGCIRMYNQNVETLFGQVDKGTPVNIIYYPSLVGWRGNELYLESHAEIPNEQELYPVHDVTPLSAVNAAISGRHAQVDWAAVNNGMDQHTGLPVLIGHQ